MLLTSDIMRKKRWFCVLQKDFSLTERNMAIISEHQKSIKSWWGAAVCVSFSNLIAPNLDIQHRNNHSRSIQITQQPGAIIYQWEVSLHNSYLVNRRYICVIAILGKSEQLAHRRIYRREKRVQKTSFLGSSSIHHPILHFEYQLSW